MYSRYSFEAPLSVPHALDRLGRLIRPRQSRWDAVEAALSWEQKSVPFVGKIEGDRFTIRRVIPYRNDFRPVISGHVVPIVPGSRIDIVLRLTLPVAVVMVVWLALACVAAAAGVWHSIRTSDARGLLAVALPLFGCGLVSLAFIPEKRKAIKILADALTDPPPTASRGSP
jgi:hypothetical protein